MKAGKIVTLIVLLAIGYQYQDMAMKQAKALYEMYPLVQTHLEMASYSAGIRTYIQSKGHLPPDFSSWMMTNFKSPTGKKPNRDFFNTPYKCKKESGFYIFRSCGRDRKCFTKDDLTLKVAKEIKQY